MIYEGERVQLPFSTLEETGGFICTYLVLHSPLPSIQYGSSAKFPGSGGAVIGYCPDLDKKVTVPSPSTAAPVAASAVPYTGMPCLLYWSSRWQSTSEIRVPVC